MSDGPAPAVLYSRSDCPLCFSLRRAAARAARRHGIPLSIVDIETDAALAIEYADRVPVLVLPGGGTLQGRVPPADVDAAFRAAALQGGRAGRPGWLRRILGRAVAGRGAIA